MIKGIVFDLDGTLLDTIGDILDNVNHTMEKYGYKTIDETKLKASLGYGSKHLIKESIGLEIDPILLDEITEYYSNRYNTYKSVKTFAYDGIMELLKSLKKQNLKLAITSNKRQDAVNVLHQELFKDLIDVAIGEGPNTPLKPNPKMIHHTLDLLGLTTKEVLFIGDTEVDLLAATNANINSVAVSWGFRSKEFLKTLKPLYLIDSPSELINIINIINIKE